jgi:hypothetical protein
MVHSLIFRWPGAGWTNHRLLFVHVISPMKTIVRPFVLGSAHGPQITRVDGYHSAVHTAVASNERRPQEAVFVRQTTRVMISPKKPINPPPNGWLEISADEFTP